MQESFNEAIDRAVMRLLLNLPEFTEWVQGGNNKNVNFNRFCWYGVADDVCG